MTDNAFDLDRFVSAQAGIFDTALSELEAGHKRSHEKVRILLFESSLKIFRDHFIVIKIF